MTRKQRRTTMIVSALVVLGAAVGLVLYALEDTIVFFYTPSEVVEKKVQVGQRFRLGGLVADGSVNRGSGTVVSFTVT
ncbi:MAG: cytochrome c maturation protein CcmE, partial [Pseudomonadota bacterium]